MTLCLPAPAKLNLFLRVTGRRSDGYHTLQTLFQLIDYGDDLSFEQRADPQINIHTKGLALEPAANLVYRAARALQSHGNVEHGVDIHLTKRLPVGGGLGGGSSDAATTLIGLNALWGLNYSKQTLAALGLQLGADVPVFIHGNTAWAEGIGEQLQAIKMPAYWYVVIAPDCQVSTAAVFADEELTSNSTAITIRAFREQGAENACQVVVEKHYAEVKAARQWLDQYAPARMTGTGACVFASFANRTEAHRVLAAKPQHWRGFIARGVNRSPVYRNLA